MSMVSIETNYKKEQTNILFCSRNINTKYVSFHCIKTNSYTKKKQEKIVVIQFYNPETICFIIVFSDLYNLTLFSMQTKWLVKRLFCIMPLSLPQLSKAILDNCVNKSDMIYQRNALYLCCLTYIMCFTTCEREKLFSGDLQTFQYFIFSVFSVVFLLYKVFLGGWIHC